MASAQAKEATSKMIRSILLPEKKGLSMKQLPGVYAELIGKRITYGEFGFRSLEAYLRSIPDVVSIRQNADGTLQCFGIADETTAHIKSLVDRQKSLKKSRKHPKPKPMFRSKPRAPRKFGGPTYKSPPSRPAAFPRPFTRNRPAPQRQAPPPQRQAAPQPQRSPPAKSSGGFQLLSSTYNNNQKNQGAPPPNKSASTKLPSKGFGKSSSWGEPMKPKSNSSNVITPPPHQAPNAAPQGSKSASVSVVNNDSRQQVGKPSRQAHQQPRVLAPRFLKQMQKELEDQRQKDQEKENQRMQKAQNLAVEHNNNMKRVSLAEQQELRITVANEYNKQEDKLNPWDSYFMRVTPIDKWPELRITVPNTSNRNGKKDDTHANDNDATEPISPAREEWPSRRQVVKEAGDWRDVVAKEERSTTPSSQLSDVRSTPPPSPAPEDVPYCSWFKKELDCKTSGLWRSGLNSNFKKDFGDALTDDIIQKMADLKILTVEKVFNQEIVYPNLKVEMKGSSSASRTVELNGHTKNQRHRSESGTASPVQMSSSTSQHLQGSQSVSSSDTTSPIPPSPPPSNPSPTTMLGRGGSKDAADYSHLAVPLPEDDVWEVYVSYIKHLQDFYVLIVDEEYTDRLFTLEEEMGHYYKYSRRRLQGPPAEQCIYAAELNKEWLRVMVDKVHDNSVDCFLVDHGDTERVDISKLQPLAPQFLHTPFQAIPCKLEGTEDDPENAEAVQKFCEVALGNVLYAEAVSKEDAQVDIVMYDEDAVATINDLCLLV